MSPEQRVFFVHLQKTAGTSLGRMMKELLGRSAIYPSDADGDPIARVIDVEHLLERWHARKDEIQVVTGHFPLCTARLLTGQFATITLLRDPVDRTLSYLRHHKKRTPADAHLTLEEVYEDPFRFNGLIHNHMVKMFSLTADEMTDGALTVVDFTPERLERAKRQLTTVDVVGLQTDFDDFCRALNARFGWELGEPVRMNRTEPTDVSDSLLERIARDNAMDIELYQFAARLCSERRSTSGDRP